MYVGKSTRSVRARGAPLGGCLNFIGLCACNSPPPWAATQFCQLCCSYIVSALRLRKYSSAYLCLHDTSAVLSVSMDPIRMCLRPSSLHNDYEIQINWPLRTGRSGAVSIMLSERGWQQQMRCYYQTLPDRIMPLDGRQGIYCRMAYLFWSFAFCSY